MREGERIWELERGGFEVEEKAGAAKWPHTLDLGT